MLRQDNGSAETTSFRAGSQLFAYSGNLFFESTMLGAVPSERGFKKCTIDWDG
jgi:hypothetical protein